MGNAPKRTTKHAVSRPRPALSAADTARCVHLLNNPLPKGHSSSMERYRAECGELLDRMCLDGMNIQALLEHDASCAAKHASYKVVDIDVRNGIARVCCGAAGDETETQRAQRLLRVATKIAEATTTRRERQHVLAAVGGVNEKSSWRSVLNSVYTYVSSVLSFGIRRPVTLMIMVAAIVLVSYGITSDIVANLTNRVGTWEIGKRMADVSGEAAMHATKTELTKAQTTQARLLIGAALPVVKGALSGVVAASAVGTLPASVGKIAVSTALGAVASEEAISAAASGASSVIGSTLRVAGEALVRFLIYSASLE